MSDYSEPEDDKDNFCFYGEALDPYDEDSIPKRRPISVEEQIATDAQGRRRFHGAFTGGFSAGFFNTVGSLEGWTPSEFKSSRSEKSKGFNQKPQDFMDDEDIGEDGIAPQVVKATSDYNTSKKRKKQVFSDGPIPGEPVLHNILTTGNETVGYMLLKNLRLQDKSKKKQETFEEKTYGCQMPKTDSELNKEEAQYEIPQMYKDFLASPKTNTFGLGYSGLQKSHFSLFPVKNAAKLITTDKNKKVSITGQAFGVGAFEEEDDDIYMKDDMTKYDFELTAEKEKAKLKQDANRLVLGMFVKSKETPVLKSELLFPPPTIPHSFTGKHKMKKSRFEPVVEEEPKPGKINPMIRAKYLGEDVQEEHTLSEPVQTPKPEHKNKNSEDSASTVDINSYLNDKFVSSTKNEDISNILETVEKTETIHGTDQMRDAARMKMFGALTRITTDWVPCALLCKRFNVPEPFADRPEKSRTKTKNIIFEYQKHKEDQANLQPGLNKEEVEEPEMKQEASLVVTEEVKNEPEVATESKPIHITESKPIDITERIHLEEKQDLFKAVFLSSDSESEEEEVIKEDKSKNEEIRKEELKSVVLSEQLLLPKIKPLKEGVLSGIHKFVKPATKIIQEVVEAKIIDSYGPKVPEIPIKTNEIIKVISSASEDEWIEKDSEMKKMKKKHKKEKKHKKDKHKKHKHEKKKKY